MQFSSRTVASKEWGCQGWFWKRGNCKILTTRVDHMVIEGKTKPVLSRMCWRGHAKSHRTRCVDKHKSVDHDSGHRVLGQESSPPSRPPRHRCQAISKKCIHRSHVFFSTDCQTSVRTFLFFRPRGSHITNKSFITLMVRNSPNHFASNPFEVKSFWV